MSTPHLEPSQAPFEQTKDAVFDQKLYVGTGLPGGENEQFEVRDRFEKVEQRITDEVGSIPNDIDDLGQKIDDLDNRVDGVELKADNSQATADAARTDAASAQAAASTAQTAANTASANLTAHKENAKVHVPSGGQDHHVLSAGATGTPFWQNFDNLLPAAIWDIIDQGGNVTSEQVINAFREITVSVWTSGGLPLGADRITSSIFAYDRFVVGGESGRVNYSFDAQVWQKAVDLFTDPLPPVPVESFSFAKTSNDETILLALDAYSDLRISMDRATWCPRLSVRVTTNSDGTYADRYETADFTHTIADRGLFLLFTSKGTVFRATYDDVISEYERAMESQSPTGDGAVGFDRHSDIWQMQSSNESITAGALSAASGGGNFICVGSLGRISISSSAIYWESIVTPFGTTNINSVAAGDDRFIAVGDNGKIGYAMFASPTAWTLISQLPFDAEKITRVIYGGGIWVAVSASGKVCASKNGITWEEVPANMNYGGTTISFGDTFFVIGDTNGNIVRSMSVASIFSVVTRAEFAALAQALTNANAAQIEEMWQLWLLLKQDVEDALAKQLVIGNAPGKQSSLGGSPGTLQFPVLDENGDPVLDEDGNPVMRPQTEVPAIDHRHDNSNTVLMSQLDRASIYNPYPVGDSVHWQGLPILDKYGKIFARNQTWQRGEPGGIAPLDENTLLPAEYIAPGWGYETLIRSIRDQMLIYWTIQRNAIFQDLGGFSRINDFAYDSTTIVAVGEKGKIAWGPNIELMQMVLESPFSEGDSVVGVAHGTKPDGAELFIAVSKTHFSTSGNGSEWSEAIEISEDIQGISFGGGLFLIPDAQGNIWRSTWDEAGNANFIPQESSDIVTRGVISIAYLENLFVGVGANNKIVTSSDAQFWNEEQSPAEADTQWNCVFPGNGIFVAVGTYGRAMKRENGSWSLVETDVTDDLHFGFYESFVYLVAGKNGQLITSFDALSWVKRDTKTNSTIRCGGYKNDRYFIGTDAGQFIMSASIYDVLAISGNENSTGPSNEDPEPLGPHPFPGVKNTYSRGDHIHPLPDMPEPAGDDNAPKHDKADGSVGELELYARADHEHPLQAEATDGDAPKRDEADGSVGVSELYARSDHEHPLQATANNPLALAEQAKPGTTKNYSREDHIHPYTGLIPQSEKGVPGGVAPLDGANLVPKLHIPPYDLEDLLNALKANVEFVQVISPFPQGIQEMSVIFCGASIGEHLALGGEAGIGYSNGGSIWQMVENQPFDESVVGMAAGLDANNEFIAIAIDTKKSFSTSRDLVEWTEKETLGGNYDFSWISYYNKTFVITSTNGQILRSVWDGEKYAFVEQEDGPEFTEGIVRVVGGNAQWVGVGLGGRIRRSFDASHFSPVESPTEKDIYCIDYGKGFFIAGGEDGIIIYGSDAEYKIGPKPFQNNEDIMSVTFLAPIGLFMVTNRIGQIATTESPLLPWVTLSSPFSVSIRGVAVGENTISIGTDQGEIASSRKIIDLTIKGGNTTIVVPREINGNYGTFQAIDRYAQPTGDISGGVRILRNQQEITEVFGAGLLGIDLDAGSSTGSATGNILTDNIVDEARERNPLIEDLEVDGE